MDSCITEYLAINQSVIVNLFMAIDFCAVKYAGIAK